MDKALCAGDVAAITKLVYAIDQLSFRFARSSQGDCHILEMDVRFSHPFVDYHSRMQDWLSGQYASILHRRYATSTDRVPLIMCARLLLELGHAERADEFSALALSLYPNDYDALLIQAKINISLERFPIAQQALLSVLSHPSLSSLVHARALALQSRIDVENGELSKAQDQLRQAMDLHRSAYSMSSLEYAHTCEVMAFLDSRMGQNSAAITSITEAINVSAALFHPSTRSLFITLSSYLVLDNRMTDAIQVLQKALKWTTRLIDIGRIHRKIGEIYSTQLEAFQVTFEFERALSLVIADTDDDPAPLFTRVFSGNHTAEADDGMMKSIRRQARNHYEESLRFISISLGPDHSERQSLENLIEKLPQEGLV
jgi:tetratricopeptide (TPR) repeat protein